MEKNCVGEIIKINKDETEKTQGGTTKKKIVYVQEKKMLCKLETNISLRIFRICSAKHTLINTLCT